ncbi:N-acetylglucosamine-6-phosphate deacetylase [Marivita geojedonensis]|uniref:N-acetylglucosamine-6-phosphate deacetylase n=2 Tax=Marivita geojedonensis TaxID=1123756 RepID=A0A1X4NKX0_9RHOB|nr:N-acetylglucosamine-6-phosphate deacetylase [Marivita geojedonensis]PRY77398.1 N-acetylglucosamine 6-phosphate deacetylase [Marivita geojedonensis]
MTRRALIGAEVFDGHRLHRNHAVLLDGDVFLGLCSKAEVPDGYILQNVPSGTLLPGFVDVQVNGGGGVLFNDDPSPQCLATIAKAHAKTGTRAFLPTLITDTPEKTRAAIEAIPRAIDEKIPGVIGLHLEGPHIAPARKGAHSQALIRPMTDEDETLLCAAAAALPNLMITVAPEMVSSGQIARLSQAGVIVSLGHSDCTFEQANEAVAAGARCVTHLFNAMSQLGSREPGLVGATLSSDTLSAGLIADGIHVHAASLRTATAAKTGLGKLFLVTDAMATVGSDITEFRLNNRRVLRRDGRLTLEDGTLAGADLDLPTALSVMIQEVGVSPVAALRMATTHPATVLKDTCGYGTFVKGHAWHGIHLDPAIRYTTEANEAL